MSLLQFLKSKTFLIQITIAIVGILVLIFGVKAWLGITTNHNQRIEVPNLHKMSLSEVKQKLNSLDLEFKVQDSASFNPEYPPKSVIEQNPEEGDFVKEKRKIYLTLNPSKYRNVEVPSLYGKTKRKAITHLKSVGFEVSEKYTYIPDLGKDVVRGLKYKGEMIKAGMLLPKTSTIELVLGDGNGN